MVANFLAGGAVVNAFARQVGAAVTVVDVGVATPTCRPADRPALRAPRKVRRRAPATSTRRAGADPRRGARGGRGRHRGSPASWSPPGADVPAHRRHGHRQHHRVGRPDRRVHRRRPGRGHRPRHRHRRRDATPARSTSSPAALARHRPDPADPLGVLAAVGGLEHAALAGFILGGAAAPRPGDPGRRDRRLGRAGRRGASPRTPVGAMIAGHRSAEPGATVALRHLGLTPLLDLGLRLGEGTGACWRCPSSPARPGCCTRWRRSTRRASSRAK